MTRRNPVPSAEMIVYPSPDGSGPPQVSLSIFDHKLREIATWWQKHPGTTRDAMRYATLVARALGMKRVPHTRMWRRLRGAKP